MGGKVSNGCDLMRRLVRRLIRLAIFLVLAWGVGLLAYVGTLYFIWNQTVGGDLGFVMFWSALALLVTTPLIYIPGLIGLHYRLGDTEPVPLFSLVAAFLGIIPTALIVLLWSRDWRSLISPEAGLFYVLFGAVGIVMGAVYAWPLQNKPNTAERESESVRQH